MKYHEGEGAGLARELANEIDRVVRMIKDRPMAGNDIGKGERKFTIDRFRYNIIYRIEEETINVLAIGPSSPKTQLLAQTQETLTALLRTKTKRRGEVIPPPRRFMSAWNFVRRTAQSAADSV